MVLFACLIGVLATIQDCLIPVRRGLLKEKMAASIPFSWNGSPKGVAYICLERYSKVSFVSLGHLNSLLVKPNLFPVHSELKADEDYQGIHIQLVVSLCLLLLQCQNTRQTGTSRANANALPRRDPSLLLLHAPSHLRLATLELLLLFKWDTARNPRYLAKLITPEVGR